MQRRLASGNPLGDLLRVRREALGLSRREAARRIGISASYLRAVEAGHNPTTGRPPQPSPTVLVAVAETLGLDSHLLLQMVGGTPPASVHAAIYDTRARPVSAVPAARILFPETVDRWVEVTDPRQHQEPDDSVVCIGGSLGVSKEGDSFQPTAALAALADKLRERGTSGRRLGIVFGQASAALRLTGDTAVLDSEDTWEQDVAAALQDAIGQPPSAVVCVYRKADLQTLAPGIDPLGATVQILRTHPLLAATTGREVLVGAVAAEHVLLDARPHGAEEDPWAFLARAAALGLSGPTRH